MADKNTRFRDLKKGDHLYWVGIDHKNFQPLFCEYELVDDMIFTGPTNCEYVCHVIPVNYNPKADYLFGKKWDGISTAEWRPGWAYKKKGKGFQMTTCLEYAEEYYKEQMIHYMKYLEEDYNKILKLYNYHKAQFKHFDFYKKL